MTIVETTIIVVEQTIDVKREMKKKRMLKKVLCFENRTEINYVM